MHRQSNAMHFTAYQIVSSVSAVMILVMGVSLWGYSVPADPELRNYRISRRFLAVAYTVLALVGLWDTFTEHPRGDQLHVMFVTLSAASYQAFLFTYAMITLLDARFMTRRRVVTQVTLITGISSTLALCLFFVTGGMFMWLFYAALVLYALQLVYYVWLFLREFRAYRGAMDAHFPEDEQRLSWVRNSFFMATGVGVAAIVSLFVGNLEYMVFEIAYTLFYIYFAVKYINYVPAFHRIAPVIINSMGNSRQYGEGNAILAVNLEKWIGEKGYSQENISLESLARALKSNQTYLSNYINSTYGVGFRQWISTLRIEEAKNLISANADMPFAEIAEMVGISNQSSFSRQFLNVIGISPGEYRKRESGGA